MKADRAGQVVANTARVMAALKGAQTPAPLHAVTLMGGYKGKSLTLRRTFQALGLRHRHQTVLHKNTSSINGMLQAVKNDIQVRPVQVRIVPEESFARLYRGPNDFFLSANSELIIREGSETAARWSAA